MSVIKKKIGNEIKSFPYDNAGLDADGNYILPASKGEHVALKPDGYNNNPSDFKYSCSSTVASLLEEGKTAIFTDDTESHRTLWRTIRDGVMTSNKNDNIYLSYEDDHVGADLGDDFIEIDNHHIFADGDLDMSSQEGGIDVFMVRCGSTYLAGNANNDHYFINISQKCKDEGYAQYITINEMSFRDDANKLHLCDFSFHNISNNPLETLANNGIKISLPSYGPSVELYFKDNPPSGQKPDIIIDHFCDNYNQTALNPPIATILDKEGIEISLQGLDCQTIATYLSTHNASTENVSSSPIINDVGNNSSHNPVSIITSCMAGFGHLISDIGDYLGLHQTELLYQH